MPFPRQILCTSSWFSGSLFSSLSPNYQGPRQSLLCQFGSQRKDGIEWGYTEPIMNIWYKLEINFEILSHSDLETECRACQVTPSLNTSPSPMLSRPNSIAGCFMILMSLFQTTLPQAHCLYSHTLAVPHAVFSDCFSKSQSFMFQMGLCIHFTFCNPRDTHFSFKIQLKPFFLQEVGPW